MALDYTSLIADLDPYHWKGAQVCYLSRVNQESLDEYICGANPRVQAKHTMLWALPVLKDEP